MIARVRRLAKGLTQAADRERLLKHAADLETQAEDLERRASELDTTVPPDMPPVTESQPQPMQQQQHEAEPSPDVPTEPPRKPET